MKKLYLTISTLLISILLNAQTNSIDFEELIVKVKPVNSIQNAEFCATANGRKDAVVVEFDVVNEIDKEKFGDKIYAIAICEEIPSEGIFNSKEIYDLKISDTQYYCWNIKIFNEDLLDRNRNKTKFWIRDLSRKITINCGY